jgi:hypothetical protein
VNAGMNDLLHPRLDIEDLRATLTDLVSPFVLAGAHVGVVPIPDVSRVSAMGRLLEDRRRRNDIYAHV